MKRIQLTIGGMLLCALALVGCAAGGGNDPAPVNAATGSTATIQNQPTPQEVVEIAAQPTSAESTPENVEPALPLSTQGVQLAVRVNGEDVSLAEFERLFARSQLVSNTASYDALAASVLDEVIRQRLINQEATRMGIVITAEEVEAEFQANRALLPDDSAWQSWLTENGFTEDELRLSLRDNLTISRVVESLMTASAPLVKEVHARHILLATQQEADDTLTRINAGEDFAALAAALSLDVTTREQGGDLGWFGKDGLLTPELAQVALSLQPNEIGGPVTTMLGYHIIQVLEVREREAQPEEMADAAAEQFSTWVDTLVQNATIERFIDF